MISLLIIYLVVCLILSFIYGIGYDIDEDTSMLVPVIIFWPIVLVMLTIIAPFMLAYFAGKELRRKNHEKI
jgi:uncharacterized BrkB/YihY/UPF0761 family membrane protein